MANDETKPLLVSSTKRDLARRRWVTVEPVVSLTAVGYFTIGLIRPLYLKIRLGKLLYNFTETEEVSQCYANNSDGGEIENDIQSQASLWLLYLVTAANVPILVTSIILGTLSDKLGRKFCLAISVLGNIGQETVYFFTVYYDLPLPVLFAGEILLGLTGGFGLLFGGSLSYLSDITTAKQRTIRMAVAEMLVFSLGGVVQAGAGYLVRYYGSMPPIAIAIGLNVVSLIYIVIPGVLIETVDRSKIADECKELLEVGRSVLKLLKRNEKGRRWKMLLLDVFLFFVLLNVNGFMAIFVLYGTAKPFCWSAVAAGLAGAYGLISGSLGMVLGTYIFSLCLGEYWIMQITCLSLFLSSIVIGVAEETWLIYIANTLGSLRGMGVPIGRSLLSKTVDPDEIGAAFSIVACVDSLSGFVSNLLAPSVYAATVSFMPSLIFYIFAALNIIPSTVVLILQKFWPRREGDGCDHDKSKAADFKTDNLYLETDLASDIDPPIVKKEY